MKLTGAQILIEELLRNGADTVFGYPGGAVLDIYDELYKNSHRINHIISAHEQGAAHAADGYARVSGKTGVVIATSGPGATNLVTGIANAYLDSVPMVAITGNVAVPLLGRDSFQEVDIVGITQPIVKHSFIVRDVNDLEHTLSLAFAIAGAGRKGPVLVDIPKSVQRESCEYIGRSQAVLAGDNKNDPDLIEALIAIAESKRPFIYAGGGVTASGAETELKMLAERIGAPVTLSMMGLTAMPYDHELNLGMCGMHGKHVTAIAQVNSDLIIAVGARFSDRATGSVSEYSKNHKIIHIDIDEAEIGKNVENIIELCGDAKKVLGGLLAKLNKKRNDEWLSFVAEHKRLEEESEAEEGFTPRNIIRTVARHANADTVVATDVGQHQMWTMQYYPFRKPNTLLTSGGLGTMGYGLGAAIGGCVANDRKNTVLFTGDGSFGMNLNELATAVSQKLPLVVVILNNGVLGMVRQWQNMFYRSHYSSTTLERKTDFVKLAKAFGAKGRMITNLEELEDVFAKGLPKNVPIVLDCRIDMDEMVFPMIPPGGSVQNVMTKKGRKENE